MATPQPNPPGILPKDDAFVAKVQKLETTLMRRIVPYSCGGKIPLKEVGDVTVYFSSANGTPTKASLPLSAADMAALQEAGTPSSFGRGDEDVYDEHYRLARELKPPHFALSVDPVLHGAILPSILFRMGAQELFFAAKLSKLNVYGTGGFFKAHRDTPRCENHVGTITVCLPSVFVGGELVVRHRKEETTYNWGTTQDAISWAFFYSDCEHEVLPVTQGSRVTLAYDVFLCLNRSSVSDPTTLSDSSSTAIETVLRDLMADDSFLPNGGVLALGLQHEYPLDRTLNPRDHSSSSLKAQDAVWRTAIESCGLKHEYVAVYNTAYVDHGVKYNRYRRGPYDPSGPVWSTKDGVDLRKAAYKGRMPFASHDFGLFDGYEFMGRPTDDLMNKRACRDLDVHWVTLPGKYGGENAFMTYGNEYNADTMYVAVAMFVYIESAAKRREGRGVRSEGGGAAAQEETVQGSGAQKGSLPVAEVGTKRPRQLAEGEGAAEN